MNIELSDLKDRKFEIGIALFLIISIASAAHMSSFNYGAEQRSGDFVRIQTSDIQGGNAFEQGTKVNIDYLVETNVGGKLHFVLDGKRVATEEPFTQSEQTYTYRWDTTDTSIGEHTYKAEFVTSDDKVYDTETKTIQIVNETVEEDSTTEKTIIREGGGSQIYDNLIEFPTQRYTPNWGFETEKNFEIVNHRDKETFVNLEVPNTPGCQYVEIQSENAGASVSYGKKAIYELPPVSTDPSRSAVSIKPLMKISAPTQEQFENSALDMPITCELETENENAGQFFVEIRPTNSPLLKTYNSLVQTVSGTQGTGDFARSSGMSPLNLVVGILFALIILGVGGAYAKNKLLPKVMG
jgi:hypothetical protein